MIWQTYWTKTRRATRSYSGYRNVVERPDSGLVELEGVEREPIETVDPTMASAKITFNNQPAQLMTNKDGWKCYFDVANRAVLYAFEQIGGAEQH